jgi:imidazolonepropionase-like amidohydrolase
MIMSKRKMICFFGFSLILLFLFCGASLFWGSEETAGSLFIKGAKVYTSGLRGVLHDAGLLIQGGKIKKILEGGNVPAGNVLDYSGTCIVPGFIDAHTYVSAYYRLLENSRVVTSDLAAFAAYDPTSPEVRAALEQGITTINLSPRNENLVGGETSIFKLSTGDKAPTLLRKEGFLKISFSKEMERDDRAPTSLMGAERMLDEWMQMSGAGKGRTDIFREEGIARLVRGEITPLIAASRYEEINVALKWLADWRKKGVIVGGEEAGIFSDELKKNDVAILLSPLLLSLPDRVYRNAALLQRKGVRIAFVSDMPEEEASGLRISALLLCQQGIPQDEALKTITLCPAQILGIADAVGSLEEGKDADLVVFSGEPLDLSSKVVAVYSNGQLVYKQD